MNERHFLDTNILVYTDSHDEPQKQQLALAIVEQARITNLGVLSTQVLQEYFVTATRKFNVPAPIARRKVELFARLNLIQIDLDRILAAIDLHRLHHFSLWDALIVRCAIDGGCSILLTEDMQHGQQLHGLEIRNPFIQ